MSHHIHIISDSTGETASLVVQACTGQFPDIQPIEHRHNFIRNAEDIKSVRESIANYSGLVFFTLMDEELKSQLVDFCRSLNIPAIDLLYSVLEVMSGFFQSEPKQRPGLQHRLDKKYFQRMDAIEFSLAHDDGRSIHSLDRADIILLGISRTSKTPTSVYLANQGIRVANIPLVYGIEFPAAVFSCIERKKPPAIGLIRETHHLVNIRKNRLQRLEMHSSPNHTDYASPLHVLEETRFARQFYLKHKIPIIDVTRKSIEEIASEIIQLMSERRE